MMFSLLEQIMRRLDHDKVHAKPKELTITQIAIGLLLTKLVVILILAL